MIVSSSASAKVMPVRRPFGDLQIALVFQPFALVLHQHALGQRIQVLRDFRPRGRSPGSGSAGSRGMTTATA
jgi:hypothetical protein